MRKILSTEWVLGLLAGVLLTLMIHYNSNLSRVTSPIFASWVAHGVGTLCSLCIVLYYSFNSKTIN